MYPQLKNLSKEQQETVELLLQQIEQQDNVQGFKDISDILLNTLMKLERDVYCHQLRNWHD